MNQTETATDQEPALVYMSTKGSKLGKKSASPLYIMSISDARKFCESEKTAGFGRGGEWAFFWTSFRNYLKSENAKPKEDDGRFDDLFSELGIKVWKCSP